MDGGPVLEAAQDALRCRPPLPQARVDEIVKEFYDRHWALWKMPWPYQVPQKAQASYQRSRMPAYPFQNAATAEGLMRQAEWHQGVAQLLCGFAFAATAAEGLMERGGDGYRGSTMFYVDQAIFLLLVATTMVFLACVMHFMYLDMGMGTRAGALYAQAYSSKLGHTCVLFHFGTIFLTTIMPLWAYRIWQLSPAFYVLAPLPVLWAFYDFGISLSSHMELNQLLAHAELGLEVPDKWAVGLNWSAMTGTHCWTTEGWQAEAAARRL